MRRSVGTSRAFPRGRIGPAWRCHGCHRGSPRDHEGAPQALNSAHRSPDVGLCLTLLCFPPMPTDRYRPRPVHRPECRNYDREAMATTAATHAVVATTDLVNARCSNLSPRSVRRLDACTALVGPPRRSPRLRRRRHAISGDARSLDGQTIIGRASTRGRRRHGHRDGARQGTQSRRI